MTKVYFTKVLEPQSLVNIYNKLGVELTGNVAVKLHSGEEGNQNYLKPEFVKAHKGKIPASTEINNEYRNKLISYLTATSKENKKYFEKVVDKRNCL